MTDSQRWMVFAGLAVGAYLLHLLAPVFTPFLVGALFAYLGDPVADRLESWKLSRTWAVVVVFVGLTLLVVAVVLLLVPLIERQVAYFIGRLPDYIKWVQDVLMPWLQSHLGAEGLSVDLSSLQAALTSHWQQAGGIAARVVASVSSSGFALVAWLANLVLIPVVTFYLLRDWDVLVARLQALLPRRVEPAVARFARESDEVLGAFLRGQFLVMLALGLIYSVGLWLVGLKVGLLIGMIAGLVSFVPYLGFIVGILAAGVAMLVQTHDPLQLLWVLGVFGVGQVMESVVLTPLLVGDRIGLHPVAVIFAVLAGGQLFGFFGVLLALPVAAVVAVAVRHAHARYVNSSLYDSASPD